MGWLTRNAQKSDQKRKGEELDKLVQRWMAGGLVYEEFARERDRIVSDGDAARRYGPNTGLVQTWLNALNEITANSWRWVGAEARPGGWDAACQAADKAFHGTDREVAVKAATYQAILTMTSNLDRWMQAYEEMKQGANGLADGDRLVDAMFQSMGVAANEYAAKTAAALAMIDRLSPDEFATLYSPWAKVIPPETIGLDVTT